MSDDMPDGWSTLCRAHADAVAAGDRETARILFRILVRRSVRPFGPWKSKDGKRTLGFRVVKRAKTETEERR